LALKVDTVVIKESCCLRIVTVSLATHWSTRVNWLLKIGS